MISPERSERHLGHPEADLLRPRIQSRGEGGFADFFGIEFSTIHRFIYSITSSSSGDHHQLVTLRLRRLPIGAMGGAARGRDRLPLARHQHDEHQAHRLRDRCHVRRLRRILLRDASGLRFARELHLPESPRSSSPSSFRRAGIADRRRDRGDGHDRRHRAAAQHRLPQPDLRPRLRPGPVPHADLRSGDGVDHGVEAARPRLDTRTDACAEGKKKSSEQTWSHRARVTDGGDC